MVGRRWVLIAVGAVALGACDGLLEVEFPGQITEESLTDLSQVEVLVNSIQAEVECGYSDFVAAQGAGFADVYVHVTEWWDGWAEYSPDFMGSPCFPGETTYGWYNPMQNSRRVGEETYARLAAATAAEAGPRRDEFMALTALYVGQAYALLGEHFCEVAFDAGPLVAWDGVLGMAEDWVTTAIGHFDDLGDVALPNDAATSGLTTAYGLRARIRFAMGNTVGAADDADEVPQGFMAWITREAGGEFTRWNRVFDAHNQDGWGTVIGPVTWWQGGDGPSGPWPNPIPFTGYLDLGILPDGRAIEDSPRYPITTTEYATATPDTRVQTFPAQVAVGFAGNKQDKYTGVADDIPWINWREMWLIQAEIEGGQDAIDRVNELRDWEGLPEVTYADPGNADQIQDMIIEERRRALWLEGRFWSHKLRHTDKLWFPRAAGSTFDPFVKSYEGAVRVVMDEEEFDLNTNFERSDRGTLCPPDQRPVLVGGG